MLFYLIVYSLRSLKPQNFKNLIIDINNFSISGSHICIGPSSESVDRKGLNLISLSGYLGLNWTIPVYLGLSKAITGCHGLSRAISGYLRPSGAISGYLGLSRAISGYLGLSWAISGYLWLSLAISGYLSDYLKTISD